MGVRVTVSSQGPDLVAELQQAIDDIQTLPTEWATMAGDVARDEILEAVRAARGTLSFSGFNATLDVAVDVVGGDGAATAHVAAAQAGMWAIVNDGTKPHKIRKPRRDRKRPTGMPTPHGVYGAVNHPGAKGGSYWDPAVDHADAEVDAAVVEAFEAFDPGAG